MSNHFRKNWLAECLPFCIFLSLFLACNKTDDQDVMKGSPLNEEELAIVGDVRGGTQEGTFHLMLVKYKNKLNKKHPPTWRKFLMEWKRPSKAKHGIKSYIAKIKDRAIIEIAPPQNEERYFLAKFNTNDRAQEINKENKLLKKAKRADKFKELKIILQDRSTAKKVDELKDIEIDSTQKDPEKQKKHQGVTPDDEFLAAPLVVQDEGKQSNHFSPEKLKNIIEKLNHEGKTWWHKADNHLYELRMTGEVGEEKRYTRIFLRYRSGEVILKQVIFKKVIYDHSEAKNEKTKSVTDARKLRRILSKYISKYPDNRVEQR